MANIQEAIRRLTIWATTPGVAESEVALNRLAAAQGGVAVASKVTEGATLSLDQKFAQLERRYNTQIRAEQDYEKVKRQVNAAVAQNPALQDRANAVLAQAAEKYGQVTGVQKAMATASQALNLQVAALAGNLGLTGQVLSAFGPWGFAAAVGLGAVEKALSFVSDKSHELAAKAKEIKEFSEATGFTVMQFQATRSEMGKFGIDAETMASGISKFTAGFAELRLGQGDLLTQVRRVNPALAEQMQRTTDSATAFTLFGKAVSETDNIFQRNALLRAGMGKGSSIYGAFFETKPDVVGLTAAFVAAGKGIDENLIKKLAQLEIDITKTRNAANTVFASMFGTSTLQAELDFANGMLTIAKYAKEFKFSDDFQRFINFLSHPATLAALGLLAAVPLLAGGLTVGTGALAVGGAGLLAGAAVGGVTRMGANDNNAGGNPTRITVGASAANFISPANRYSDFQGASNKTPQADLADMEKRIALLGSAATATEKYEVAALKLDIAQRNGEISGNIYNRALAGLNLDKQIAQQSLYTSALGAAAPIEDLIYQKRLQLQKAQAEDPRITDAVIKNQERLTREQANGVAAVNSQIDAINIQSATYGMSAGAAAAFTAVETKRLENLRNGRPDDAAATAALRERAKVLGETTQKSAQDSAQNQANFELATVYLSDIDKQIAQLNFRLHGKDWQDYTDSMLSNTTRVTAGIRDMNDASRNAFSSFFTDVASGKHGVDLLTSSLGNMAQTLQKASLNRLYDGLKTGDLSKVFGNQSLNSAQGALGIASAGAAGYQSGSPLSGALGGAMAGATFGPAGAAVGGVVGLIGGILGASDKQRKALQAAQEQWRQAGPAFETFLKQMSGGQQGSVSKAISDASAQEAAFEKQAWDARDTAAINAARAGLQKFSDTQKTQFAMIFDSMAKGFETGMGPDSAFLKSVNTVKSALDSTLGFIDDAKEVFGNVAKGENGAAAARATAAAQTYLLALLQTPAPLSQVQQGLQNIQGTASALQGALVQLGMSSADAATAINAGVSKSIASLKTQFEAGLTERLNAANGQSFLSDATRLISQHQQDLIDAAALGVDQAAVAALFHAEAQKIVNDAGLVGDAFTSFTKQFPQLADVVTQASQDVSDAVKQQQDALNSSAKTILEYVNSITAGQSSTLSPQDRYAAAQSVYNAKLVLAQSGNADAQSTIPQDAENYRAAAQAMFGSAAGYQSVVSQIRTQLLALPAVQQTTDPVLVVMRDVLTAINAGILTQATDATLLGSLLPAINQGNAAAVAVALSTYFNKIDTNTSGDIDLGEMQTALAGMASNSALVSMFTRLDTDNSGSISRLELIKAASQATNDNTSATATNTANTKAAIDAANALDTAIKVATEGMKAWGAAGVLDSIKSLQDTATQNLTLMKTALATTNGSLGSGINIYSDSSRVDVAQSTANTAGVNNQLVQALNKIVWNTFTIANNTAIMAGTGHLYGTYATGGWITGGIPGVDSVRILAQRDEFMVNPYATRALTREYGPGVMDLINSGRLPSSNDNSARRFATIPNVIPFHGRNDNAELLARIDRLTAEVAQLRRENNKGHSDSAQAASGGAQFVRDGVDAVQRDTGDMKRAANMRR